MADEVPFAFEGEPYLWSTSHDPPPNPSGRCGLRLQTGWKNHKQASTPSVIVALFSCFFENRAYLCITSIDIFEMAAVQFLLVLVGKFLV